MDNSSMQGINRIFGGNHAAGSSQPLPQTSLSSAADAAKAVVDKAGKLIAEHPGVSLGAALTCGVVLGWLIKRTD